METRKKEGILLESGTNEVEFIEFFLGGESYGINVSKVQHVNALSQTKVTAMAQSDPATRGIIHVREKPVILIDLRKALNIQAEDVDADRKLVLILEFNQIMSSYVIDGVNKIHRTNWKNFRPMTEVLSGQKAYTVGTITIDDRVILILDLESLMLDFMPQQLQKRASAQPIESKKERRDIRILYAEDSKIVRKMTMNMLKEGGYTNINAFENGQQASDYLDELRQKADEENKNLRDYVDLILTDIEMPEMDGLTLCRRVKSAPDGKDIPAVIVYSSLINQQMVQKCKAMGADSQLSKPHGDTIITEIDKLFGL